MTAQTPEKLTRRIRREAAIPPQRAIVRDVITQRELEAVLLLDECQSLAFGSLVKRYFAGASIEPGEIEFDPGNLDDIHEYAGGCSGLNCLSAQVNRRKVVAPTDDLVEPSGATPPAGEPEEDESKVARLKLDAFIEKHGDAAVLEAIGLYEKIATLDLAARYSALSHIESCALGYPIDSESNCRLLGEELVEETYESLMKASPA
ncbi:MAG TPA: hypothetical protein VM120_07490 [Bryobacteraceae bacterium]|nr:hypothetical protein [Bryobacteraceae bacterium]